MKGQYEPQSGPHLLIAASPTAGSSSALYLLAKRSLDLLLVVAALPFLLPVCLLIAMLIRLDSPGPILFVHRRVGKDGRRFPMLKFRTMVAEAQSLQPALAHLNEQSWPSFKMTNDPRVTRLGRILRRTSLDELPQVINIVKGDMSWVGPRPHSWDPDDYHYSWQRERLSVIPGLTGLGQIAGRSDLDVDREIELDLEYVRHRSLRLDVFILVKTISAVLDQRGAY